MTFPLFSANTTARLPAKLCFTTRNTRRQWDRRPSRPRPRYRHLASILGARSRNDVAAKYAQEVWFLPYYYVGPAIPTGNPCYADDPDCVFRFLSFFFFFLDRRDFRFFAQIYKKTVRKQIMRPKILLKT